MSAARRARSGRTNDPCHGCGAPNMDRLKESVCQTCAGTLRLAREAAAEVAQHGDGAPVPMFMKERAYALPYIGNCNRDPLQAAFFDLGQRLSSPTELRPTVMPPDSDHRHHWHDFDKLNVWPSGGAAKDMDWHIARLIAPGIAGALGKTYAAVMVATDEAYRKGYAEGRSLIARLAGGEITADQFNDQALRREGKA